MALPPIGHEFLVVSEPELRFTPAGIAVCNFRVKASSRKEEPQGSGNWVDKDVLWANVSAWRELAEHVAESIKKDDLVMVVGTISTREFESNGVKQKAVEIQATGVGPSLKFRTTPHGAAQQQQAQQPPQQGYQQPFAQPQGQPQYAPQQGQPQYAPQQGQPYQQPQGQPQYQQPAPQGDPWAQPQQTQPPF